MAYRFANVPDKMDINFDFWENNYWMKFIEPYKELYETDTSKNKTHSSMCMLCIWLEADPSYQNKIGKLQKEEKRSAILAYYPKFDFKDDLINRCIVAYDEHCLSDAARTLKRTLNNIARFQEALEKKMDTEDLTWDELVEVAPKKWVNRKGTAGQILDISKKLTATWKEYEPIKRIFEEEQHAMELYGGNKPTIVEEGGLILLPDDED